MATGSKKVIYAALAGNALIAITRFIAAMDREVKPLHPHIKRVFIKAESRRGTP